MFVYNMSVYTIFSFMSLRSNRKQH